MLLNLNTILSSGIIITTMLTEGISQFGQPSSWVNCRSHICRFNENPTKIRYFSEFCRHLSIILYIVICSIGINCASSQIPSDSTISLYKCWIRCSIFYWLTVGKNSTRKKQNTTTATTKLAKRIIDLKMGANAVDVSNHQKSKETVMAKLKQFIGWSWMLNW